MKKILLFLLLISLKINSQSTPSYEKKLVNIVRSDSISVARSSCAGYGENNPHPIWYNNDPVHDYEFSMPNASDYYVYFNLYNILTFKQDPQVIPCSNSDFKHRSIEFSLLDENGNVNYIYRIYPQLTGTTYSSFRIYNIEANKKQTFRVKIDDNQWGVGWYELQIIATDFLNTKDRNALIDLYNSTNGMNWSKKWDLNKSSASWKGVYRLNLPGSSSTDFSVFRNLNVGHLELHNNNLSGKIPSSIGNLTELRSLNMRNNNLIGKLPESIGNLKKLEQLYIDKNNLSGKIPNSIKNLENLEFFYLYENNFQGSFSHLKSLASLKHVGLFNNKFQFGDFENEFNLYQNKFYNFYYQPQKQISLDKDTIVTLGSNIQLIANASGSKNKYQWYFNNSLMVNETSPTLNLNNIKNDNIGKYQCFITSDLVPNLTLQTGVFSVIQDSTTHPDYNALISLYNTTNGNNWSNSSNWNTNKPLDTWHGVTLKNNRVIALDLDGNNLVGYIPKEIGELTELTFLDLYGLGGNDLSGEVPSEIWELKKIEFLRLGAQKSQALTMINNINKDISNLEKLYWLNLNGIKLSQSLLPEILKLPKLRFLRLQKCGLSGNLPIEFSNIYDLYIGYNDFTGPIPDEIINSNVTESLGIINCLFDFNELSPLVKSTNIKNLYYSPQRTKDTARVLNIISGSRVVFSLNKLAKNYKNKVLESVVVANSYQWYKDNKTINGANLDTYTIENVKIDDNGYYHCEITNSHLPGLVIKRVPIQLNVNASLNVNENEFVKNNVSIYPNPTEEFISIVTNKSLNFEKVLIYDLLGKKVKMIKSNFDNINVSDLSNGVYFLKISTDKGFANKKIIIN